MPAYRTVLRPPRRRRHEPTACSSLANSDIAPSSFLEIPLLCGRGHWEGGPERAWRSQDLSSRSGGAKRTVILTKSRLVCRTPRAGRLICWQDRPGRRRTGHALAGIRGTNTPWVEHPELPEDIRAGSLGWTVDRDARRPGHALDWIGRNGLDQGCCQCRVEHSRANRLARREVGRGRRGVPLSRAKPVTYLGLCPSNQSS